MSDAVVGVIDLNLIVDFLNAQALAGEAATNHDSASAVGDRAGGTERPRGSCGARPFTRPLAGRLRAGPTMDGACGRYGPAVATGPTGSRVRSSIHISPTLISLPQIR